MTAHHSSLRSATRRHAGHSRAPAPVCRSLRTRGTHRDNEGEHHEGKSEPDFQLGKRGVVSLPLQRGGTASDLERTHPRGDTPG